MQNSELVRANGRRCPYCNRIMNTNSRALEPSRDHKLPRSRGGFLTPDNKVICCRKCNTDKGNRTLSEFGRQLKEKGDPRHEFVDRLACWEWGCDAEGT